MAAATIEEMLLAEWSSSDLTAEIPVQHVHIGLLPQRVSESMELRFPVASIRRLPGTTTSRTNEGDQTLTSNVRILAGFSARPDAARAQQAILDHFDRLDGVYQGGSIQAVMMLSDIEEQTTDGAWFLGWNFQVIYTIAA